MTYRERRLRRAERLRDWATGRRDKSRAAFAAADRIAQAIPMGQPILVGHHSEKHHRRDVARIESGMSKGIEHERMADSMASRADEIERQADAAIYSDDADAVERLTDKIATLEATRETMKTRNADFRKANRDRLKAMTSAYDRDLAMPHQGYELQNLGGNISRLRKRLAYLRGSTASIVTDAATATARAGLVVTAGMTTPSRPGKAPRPVWTVTGAIGGHRQLLAQLGGTFYRGGFSFWDDPAADLEAALIASESGLHTSPDDVSSSNDEHH